jgi:hypothetical protein
MLDALAYQPFGMSDQTESSWPDALCEAHSQFILAYVEMRQSQEEALLADFLERKRLQ